MKIVNKSVVTQGNLIAYFQSYLFPVVRLRSTTVTTHIISLICWLLLFTYLLCYVLIGAPAEYTYFGRCDQICTHCHALFWLEEKITSFLRSAPLQYHRCCAAGRAVLRTHQRYPPYIRRLFSDRHFMENIRAYNRMLAMTSLRATIDNSINTGRGPYVFRVLGQIYHWIGF